MLQGGRRDRCSGLGFLGAPVVSTSADAGQIFSEFLRDNGARDNRPVCLRSRASSRAACKLLAKKVNAASHQPKRSVIGSFEGLRAADDLVKTVFGSSGQATFRKRLNKQLQSGLCSEPLRGQRTLKMQAAPPPDDDLKISDTPAATPSIPSASSTAKAELDKKYNFWRIRTFAALLLGYAGSYVTRQSFTYVAPVMRSAGSLSLEQIGIISSIQPAAYGFSKFVSGIMADALPPRYFLAVGLIITGLLNAAFTLSSNVGYLSSIWFMVGWVSAFGGPCCAKMLSSWFSQSERGTWWGIWNSSHNIGGFLATVIAGYSAQAFGWKLGMIIPGMLGVFLGFAFMWAARSNPAEVGLPPVDEWKGEKAVIKKDTKPEEKVPASVIVKKYVLSNPYVWTLAISYFFIYFVRSGVTNWSHFYLLDSKGVDSAAEAAFRVSGREIGGLGGSLFSGFASDKFFKGKRIPVICIFLAGLAAAIVGFWAVPPGNRYLDWLLVTLIGFFLYGPQMLVGLAGVELSHRSAASTATGFLGWIAYIGAGIAGAPLTILVKKYGWNSFFWSLIGCCGAAFALLAPMWNKKSYDEEQAAKLKTA